MYIISKGNRIPVREANEIESVLNSIDGNAEYVDVEFGFRRQTAGTLLKVYSLLPNERKGPIVMYVDSDGKVFARYRLLSREDAVRVCMAVAYYDRVGPHAGFGIREKESAQEVVLKLAQHESLRILLTVLGVIERQQQNERT